MARMISSVVHRSELSVVNEEPAADLFFHITEIFTEQCDIAFAVQANKPETTGGLQHNHYLLRYMIEEADVVPPVVALPMDTPDSALTNLYLTGLKVGLAPTEVVTIN